MKKIFLMYSHRMAPGRAKEYLKASDEAFELVDKHIKSENIKDIKVLRALTGDESFAMIAEFDSMEKASLYMDDFNKSGISLKYQDVQLNTKIQLFEVLEDDDIQGIFNILKVIQ